MNLVFLTDTLQTAVDTVYFTQSELTETDWPVVLTAVSTTLYFVATCFIFWKTWEQAQATKTTAEASVEANKIAKRVEFFPEFDLRADTKKGSTTVQTVPIKIESISQSVIYNVALFYLIDLSTSQLERARRFAGIQEYLQNGAKRLAGYEKLDNVKNAAHRTITCEVPISKFLLLIRFSDAIQNTYYRSATYAATDDTKGPPQLELSSQMSTELTSWPIYRIRIGIEGNIFLSPFEDYKTPYSNLPEEVPEPVQRFNEASHGQTRGLYHGEL